MLNKTNKIIESFLPVFCGFYNTIFEPDESNIIEDPFTYDNYEFEYDTYRTYRIDIAKACVNGIEKYSYENYLTKDVTTITGELVVYFEDDYNNRIGETQPDFLTYKYIENIVNRVFNGIEKNTLTLEFKNTKK